MEIIRKHHDNARHLYIVALKGKIVSHKDTLTLDEVYDDMQASGSVHLLLNIKEVDYISSSGLGKLCDLLRIIGEQEGKFGLVEMNHNLMELFRMTKLEKKFYISSHEEGFIAEL